MSWLKPRNRREVIGSGYFLLLHTAFVVFALVQIVDSVQQFESGEAVMAWNLFLILDFPASMLVILLNLVFYKFIDCAQTFNPHVTNIYAPALLYGFIGGVQYYFLGLFATRYLVRKAEGKRGHH